MSNPHSSSRLARPRRAIEPTGTALSHRASNGVALAWTKGNTIQHHLVNSLLCAGETGGMLWMKEPYEEGVATHFGPESCAVVREGGGEALTGVRPGWPLSRENVDSFRGADALAGGGRPHSARRHRETRRDLARPETPRTDGTIPHGNREVPRLSATEGAADRIGKSEDTRR